MDQQSIEAALADLPIPAVRYHAAIDSTNDEAARWAEQGAPDLALVVADEQTAGRGRLGRRWYTTPGSALAFSLVLHTTAYHTTAYHTTAYHPMSYHPPGYDAYGLQQLTALGALAVQRTLKRCCQLPAQIKWPNDVLVDGLKVAGILAEAHWLGDELTGIILGIGINIASPSAMQVSAQLTETSLPVTSLQDAAGKPVEQLRVLREVLKELLVWRLRLGTPEFLQGWEEALAYRGEWVIVDTAIENGSGSEQPTLQGKIVGLAEDGSLILQLPTGESVMVYNGDVRVRPVR